MGTRSLTTFIDDFSGDEIVVMYRQMDGYPSGHGKELVKFLDGIQIVNGINMNEKRKIANGVSCLAAQTVAHFKEGAGNIYLHSSGVRDYGEEYVYTIYLYNETKKLDNEVEKTNNTLKVKVYKVYDNKYIFDGTVDQMKDWLETVWF